MSFFSYKPHDVNPPPPQPEPQNEPKIDPFRVIIEGSQLIKEVEDDPSIPDARVDIGNGMTRLLQPLNYNVQTGEIQKWE